MRVADSLAVANRFGALDDGCFACFMAVNVYNDIDMIEQDFTWLNDHGADLIRDYAGKWIAVADGDVVGVGETATQASAKASEKLSPGDFILEHVDAEVDVVYELS